jgi:hypothetical protein
VHAAALSKAALVAAQPRPSWRIRYNGRVNGHVRNGDKRMLGRLQKTAILLAIGVFFATTISAEIFDASNRSHAAINQKTPKRVSICKRPQILVFVHRERSERRSGGIGASRAVPPLTRVISGQDQSREMAKCRSSLTVAIPPKATVCCAAAK